jgi:predicted PurR-regulated permease PerM
MMNTSWSKPTKYLAGIGLVFLGIFILHLSGSVVPMLIWAALIAVIVRPVLLWLEARVHLSHGLAVGLIYLCLAMMLPLVIILVVPTIADTLVYIGNLDYQSTLQGSAEWLRSTLIAIKTAQLPVAGFDAYIDRAADILLEAFQPYAPTAAVPPTLTEILQPLSSALVSVVETGADLLEGMISHVAKLGFIFLASMYISLDAPAYRGALLQAAPAAYRPEFSILIARIERVWNAFLHGELTLMLVIGGITTLGLTALGVPGALYLGIIAGLLEIIPSIGPIIATVPAVIVALIQGSATLPISNLAFAGLIILFYILVQQVENSLIVPRVLGDALELPPLIVLTGVVVGATVGGILGALLATPVIATGREILSYVHRKIWNQELIQTGSTDPETGTAPLGNTISARLSELHGSIRSRSPEPRQETGEE